MKCSRIAILCLLALGGCAIESSTQNGPGSGLRGPAVPASPSDASDDEDGSDFLAAPERPSDEEFLAQDLNLPEDEIAYPLEEAPSVEELLAGQVEPLGVEMPSDFAEVLGAELHEKKVIGAENRQPVSNTTVTPYSTIATLLVTFPGAPGPGLCTGSFIGKDAVLTAAHCVYSHKYKALASNIRVIPGAYPKNGVTQQPFGSTSGRALYRPQGYVNYPNKEDFWKREQHDYAVVRTNLALGVPAKAGARAFGVLANPAVGRFVQLVGYHGDICVGGPQVGGPKCIAGSSSYIMSWSSDKIRAAYTNVFNHYSDSNPGASGSPLVTDGADFNKIFAVHVAGQYDPATGAEWNMGVLITNTAYANIVAWSK